MGNSKVGVVKQLGRVNNTSHADTCRVALIQTSEATIAPVKQVGFGATKVGGFLFFFCFALFAIQS